MQIRVSSNARSVAREFAAVGAASHAALATAVATQGSVLQRKVKANASGRPGPRAQTGDYRRSISLQVRREGSSIVAEVSSNAVQAARLEYGFWGMTDSLGRLFHQPAYPHFGPAGDDMERVFPVAIEAALAGTFRVLRAGSVARIGGVG
jgi:hypothetical protein